jgi:hypothetical protein
MSVHPRPPALPAGRAFLVLSAVAAAATLLLASRLLPVELGRQFAPPATTMPAYLQAENEAGAPRPTATVVSSDALSHVPGSA